MSVDFFFVTPESYTLETFLRRFSDDTITNNLGNMRFNINFDGFEKIWIEEWDYIASGYKSLEEAFEDTSNLDMIYLIHNPRIFLLTSKTYSILYDIAKVIADDHNILIDSGRIGAPFRWGDEFVAMIRRGEEP